MSTPLVRITYVVVLAAMQVSTVFAQISVPGRPPPDPQMPAPPGLYQALGERPGIERMMGDLVTRLIANPRIAHHFKKTKPEDLKVVLTDQLCMVSGGPCRYRVRMGPAHEDMKITRADFNALVEDLQDAMDAAQVPFRRQNQLLALLAPMHRLIIELH